jgi:hypothetical protein
MSTSTALSQYKIVSALAATAAEVFGSTSGEAIIAEQDRLESLQAALAAIFADAVHLHGLDDARVMRYAGVRYGFHLTAFEDERELYVAGYDVNLRLRFVQRECDLEVLWEAK